MLISFLPVVTFGQVKSNDSVQYERPIFDFNPGLPTLSFENQSNDKGYLRFYTLSGYREGVESTQGPFGIKFEGIDHDDMNARRLYMYNLPIAQILTHGFINDKFIILKVKDPQRYSYKPEYGAKDVWMRKYAKCFEVLLPNGMQSISILDRFLTQIFNVQVARENHATNVFILKRTSKLEKFVPRTNEPSSINNGSFVNVTFEELTNSLSVDGKIFIDETGFQDKIQIDLRELRNDDLEALNTILKRYDLHVSIENRRIEFFIISASYK